MTVFIFPVPWCKHFKIYIFKINNYDIWFSWPFSKIYKLHKMHQSNCFSRTNRNSLIWNITGRQTKKEEFDIILGFQISILKMFINVKSQRHFHRCRDLRHSHIFRRNIYNQTSRCIKPFFYGSGNLLYFCVNIIEQHIWNDFQKY